MIALAPAQRRLRLLLHQSLDEVKARTRKRIASSRGSKPFSPENGPGDVDAVKCSLAYAPFQRLHAACLNVLQTGVYANSPIFHQPYDTTHENQAIFTRNVELRTFGLLSQTRKERRFGGICINSNALCHLR